MPGRTPGAVTRLLREWRAGNPQALDDLIPLVYDELRRLARRSMSTERPDHTLQPTALVHEAYARLVDSDIDWEDRAHFMAVMAQAMRRVLIDHARARRSEKRGSGGARVTLDDAAVGGAAPVGIEILDLDRALERLEQESPPCSRIVELHFFGGLTFGEIARTVGCSEVTARRQVRFARAWLLKELGAPGKDDAS